MILKTEIIPFLTVLNQVVLQNVKKSFEEAHFDAKIYWISSATPWNSIIVITLPSRPIFYIKIIIYLRSKHKLIFWPTWVIFNTSVRKSRWLWILLFIWWLLWYKVSDVAGVLIFFLKRVFRLAISVIKEWNLVFSSVSHTWDSVWP